MTKQCQKREHLLCFAP
ncbi:unnamed protein product [Spirodela intermedia]|uniref:Uncharacterized protein n=1 Tax=Spirodela intermedia TaxID=51605 RepID=A0A7I8L0A4_SPIIN|nr:unnamed protein product [Spirodela intermedia]